MPPKRVYRKRRPARVVRRKRVFRKKSRFSKPSLLKYNPRNRGVLVPDRFMTTMKVTGLSHVPANSGLASLIILGNGLIDPFGTAGTVNVTGFAQMTGLYSRYIIHGSRLRIDAVAETGTIPRVVTVLPHYGSVPSATTSIMDAAYVKSKMLSGLGGMDRGTIVSYMSTKKLAGLKDLKDEENQWGTSSTNPGFQWLWNVRADNNTGAGTEVTAFRYTITYYVEWFDRVELNQA